MENNNNDINKILFMIAILMFLIVCVRLSVLKRSIRLLMLEFV